MAIRRIHETLDKDEVQAKKARLGKEIKQLRKDYEIAGEQNGELYDLVEAEEHDTLHQWDNDLANDVSSIEEVEVSSTVLDEIQVNTTGFVEDASHASNTSASVGDTNHSSNADDSTGKASYASNASEANTVVLCGTQDNQVALIYRQIPRSSPFLARI